MSWKVANLCADRLFGSPVRKQIVMFLADKASDDGSGIWCSKGTIQRHTELGESTVKRTINEFLAEGILLQTGHRRRCKNGFTKVYRLDLGKIEQLEMVREPDDEPGNATGFCVDPVQHDPPTGSTADGVPGPQRTLNHPKTIPEPPTRASAPVAGDEDFEKVWAAYPEDRRRNRSTCLTEFRGALEQGFTSPEILAAVKTYAMESAGFTRSKVFFSDNWFRQGKWRNAVEDARAAAKEAVCKEQRHLAGLAEQVKRQDWICQHITPLQAQRMLAGALVSQSDLDRAKVST